MDLLTWLRAEWDRVAGVALIILGVIFVAVGYNGVANSPYVAEELAYLASGAVGGLFLLGTGAMLWLSADLHDEWRKLDRIEAAIRGQAVEQTEDAAEDHRENGDDRDDHGDDGGEPAMATNGGATNGKSKGRQLRVGSARGAGVSRLVAALQPRVAPGAEGQANLSVLVGLAAAAAVVVIGWSRAAGEGDPKRAFAGLAIAVAGVIAASTVVVGYTLWLRRSVRNRQVELLGPYLVADAAARLPATAHVERVAAASDRRVVVAAGLTRFHQPGCPAVVGLKTRSVARDKVRSDLSGCGICGSR